MTDSDVCIELSFHCLTTPDFVASLMKSGSTDVTPTTRKSDAARGDRPSRLLTPGMSWGRGLQSKRTKDRCGQYLLGGGFSTSKMLRVSERQLIA